MKKPHLYAKAYKRTRPICCSCRQPILVGEAHWAGDPEGRPWHYRCAEQAGLTIPHRPTPRGSGLKPGKR